jgi:molybdate transport system substrate-binding protein
VVVDRDGAIANIDDLRRVGRLAIGDPVSVPAGNYARQWLESVGLWSGLAPRVVRTLDVRAALTAVENGSADAAIVYRTDAAMAKQAKVAFEPVEQPNIVYPIAVLSRARRAEAERFVEFVLGAGRETFDRFGFARA